MTSMKLSVLFTVLAVVAFASSKIIASGYDNEKIKNALAEDKTQPIKSALDVTDNENNDDVSNDDNAEIDGIPLKYLTEKELHYLLDEEDNLLISELDILVARKIVNDRRKGVYDVINGAVPGGRQKRFIGPLFNAAARILFGGAVKVVKPTVSGNRVTQQYTKSGSYEDAIREFNNFSPDNVKSFTKEQGISGQTGHVGDHKVTVRDGSTQGSPTLEIRTPKPDGEYVRKFRYEGD